MNIDISFLDMAALEKPQAIVSKENAEENRAENGSESYKSTYVKRGMVLPFTPLTMSFDNVNYYVDMPKVTRNPQIFVTLVKLC